jgi:membrane-associated phospholipid phosphatase
MKKTAAKLISTVGNPLFTIPLFVIIVMFSYEDYEKATLISAIIIGLIFIPLIIRMYIKSKNGSYTNFDVSDRVQRKSLFHFALPLVMIAILVLFTTGQSKSLCISVFFGLTIAFISQIVNLFVKSSLHVSLNIYLSFLIMPINSILGSILLLLTVLIGWSRIVLGRHTLKEVLFGAGIGLSICIIMLLIQRTIYN